MDALAAEFAAHLEALRRSPKTIEAYGLGVDRLARHLQVRAVQLASAPRSTLAQFAADMSAEGLAPATVQLYTTAASEFLKWVRTYRFDVPTMDKPVLPRHRYRRSVVLREMALATYIEVCRTVPEPYRTALMLLPCCGLRITELCQMRLADIDVSPPWVRFDVTGKGDKERRVPVLQQAQPLLVQYLRDVRPGLPGDTWLFPNTLGRPVSPRLMRRHMRRVRGRMGMPNLTPHMLRHTYLTILNESGITGFDLAQIAGHSNLSTTRLYVHPSDKTLSDRVSRIHVDWLGRSEEKHERTPS